jgi:hypothetical protein
MATKYLDNVQQRQKCSNTKSYEILSTYFTLFSAFAKPVAPISVSINTRRYYKGGAPNS